MRSNVTDLKLYCKAMVASPAAGLGGLALTGDSDSGGNVAGVSGGHITSTNEGDRRTGVGNNTGSSLGSGWLTHWPHAKLVSTTRPSSSSSLSSSPSSDKGKPSSSGSKRSRNSSHVATTTTTTNAATSTTTTTTTSSPCPLLDDDSTGLKAQYLRPHHGCG